MDVVERSIKVEAPIDIAYKVYVEEIDVWWPRQGEKFRYSFAPADVEPDRIVFESQIGGRFFERFSDGSEYDIGRVVEYDPPTRFVYTWQAPDWPGETTIEVSFHAEGESTRVDVRHSGFESAGASQLAEGYGEGLEEVLETFRRSIEEGRPEVISSSTPNSESADAG